MLLLCCCCPETCIHFFEADTDRAVGLLRRYQANLTSPEEQALKTSVGKVSTILGSQLFQALLGKKNTVKLLVWQKGVFQNFALWLKLHHSFLRLDFLNNFSCSHPLLFE